MNTLRATQYGLRKLERGRAMRRLLRVADHMVSVIGNRTYKGTNPAIGAVYSPIRYGLIVMVILFVVIFVFGSFVPLESAAIAQGTIAVLSSKKTVQHLEGGIIRDILVKEGELVKEGQTLLVLNDIAPKANETIMKSELYAAQVTEARLMALRSHADSFGVSEEIRKAAEGNADLAKAMATQKDLFDMQRAMQEGKLQTLAQRIKQYNEEIIGLEAQVASAKGQLALIAQEIKPMERLVKNGYAAMPKLLELQRRKEELEGNRGQYIAAIAKARQSITEAELQIVNTKNEFATQNADELRDVHTKTNDYEEKVSAASDIMQRTTIVAPHEGIVTGLKYHTIGGVIAPGSPIMDIVPQGEKLIVEAQVAPHDIDVVDTGMNTRVVFSAYKTRSMPQLSGKVIHVSADTFTAQDGSNTAPYYTAKVEVDSEQLAKLDTKMRLYPGMPVEVYIHTGSRSFLGYLLAPVTSSLQRAFKED